MFLKIVLLGLFVCGCGEFKRLYTGVTGGLTYKCSKSGVEYVQSDSGLALHVDCYGQVIRCH